MHSSLAINALDLYHTSDQCCIPGICPINTLNQDPTVDVTPPQKPVEETISLKLYNCCLKLITSLTGFLMRIFKQLRTKGCIHCTAATYMYEEQGDNTQRVKVISGQTLQGFLSGVHIVLNLKTLPMQFTNMLIWNMHNSFLLLNLTSHALKAICTWSVGNKFYHQGAGHL